MAQRRSGRIGSQQPTDSSDHHESVDVSASETPPEQQGNGAQPTGNVETPATINANAAAGEMANSSVESEGTTPGPSTSDVVEPPIGEGQQQESTTLDPARPLASYSHAEIRAMSPAQRLAYKARLEYEKAQREAEVEAEALFIQAQALSQPRAHAIPSRAGRGANDVSHETHTEHGSPEGSMDLDEPTETAPIPQKRRRSSSSDGVKPPAVDVKKFNGESIEEKLTFDIQLQNHFDRNSYYYRGSQSVTRRILAAISALGDGPAKKWYTLRKEGKNVDQMTWEDLDAFLIRCIKDPRILGIEAECKVETALQLEHQRVSDFNVYLRNWERHLPLTYTEAQRISRLRTKILESIRVLATSRYRDEPTDYDRYVTWLQVLEDGMPERQETLKRLRARPKPPGFGKPGDGDRGPGPRHPNRERPSYNGKKYRPDRNPRPSHDGNKLNRNPSGFKPETQGYKKPKSDLVCSYCHNPGHTADECRKKRYELGQKGPNRK